MRILICSNVYPPKFIGGAEIVAHRQALALQSLGHDVHVFAGDIRDIGPRHHFFHETYDGIEVSRVRLTHEDFALDGANFVNPAVEQLFVKVFEEFRPDIVHSHNLLGLSANIPLLAWERGARTVVTLHDHWGYCFKNTAERTSGVFCEDHRQCAECMPFFGAPTGRRVPVELRMSYLRHALGYVDRFISPSDYLAQKYIAAGFAPERMLTVWNGIDEARFAPLVGKADADKVRFSFFGYFGRHKGIDVLLKATSRLGDPARVQINLIGEGDQEDALRELARNLGIAEYVKFWGKIDNREIVDAYAQTDVLVLPSVWPENQPVSITEALAGGIPVLASRVGGVPELVIDRQTGLTFSAGSSEELSIAMQEMIEDEDLRHTLGEGGRRLIAGVSFDSQAKRLESIYDEVLLSERKGRPQIRIIVAGDRATPEFVEGVRLFDRIYPEFSVAFGADEWFVESDFARAAMVIVMGDGCSVDDIAAYRAEGLPVLLPASLTEEMSCLDGGTAIFSYETAEDLAGLTGYILKTIGCSDYGGNEKQ